MATKLAELESLLYLAGDTGVEQSNLCQLLEVKAPALRELAKKLTQKLS